MFHVPLRIAMHWWAYDETYKIYSLFVDTISLIDVLVHFRTAYKSCSGIVSDPVKVAKQYIKTWFLIDLLAAIPFDILAPTAGQTLQVFKYLRLPKLLRMGRLLRVIRKRARYYGILVNVLAFIMFWHFWSCIWIGTTIDCAATPQYCTDDYVWPIYVTTLRIMLSMLLLNDSTSEWIEAGYFNLKEGPISNEVHGLQIAAMLAGVLLIGTLFATVASVLETFNGEGQRYHNKLSKFKKEMEYFGLDKGLKDHVLMHYEYLWMHRKSYESISLLRDPEVSDHIRRNICVFLYRDVVEKVPFFYQVESDFFVEAVCMNLVLKVFMPGDFILCSGDDAKEFCMINEGSVCILSESGGEKLAVLTKGSFFGETELINGALRVNSIIAICATEICMLPKEVFLNLRKRFPQFDSLISVASKKRLNQLLERSVKYAQRQCNIDRDSSFQQEGSDAAVEPDIYRSLSNAELKT